ncbi:aminotransferase class III-fold pyridoxal phosphate-dependent enzyme [Algoriphagus sp. SE2]|uniref:aspartate aminotransferase family protein n=1 Tax=Algoriphagus sp. SE2 TaxID=3141536 RepID=UPI0031CD42C8
MLKTISKSQTLFERRKNAVANGVGVFNTATVREAKGAIIIDEDGNELIDFAGGIGVVNAGHCPEPVVQAIKNQADKYLHTSFNVVTYEPYIKLCEELCEILPHGDKTKAMLISTGAEAVENAIKIARQATKRQGVVCFTDAYHGRTMMAMTLTSKIDYKIDCGPFSPEVYRIPFPNFYRYGKGESLDNFVESSLKNLHASAKNLFDPKSIAAVIIEPVQGEGGFNAVPHKYFEGLRKFCDDHGILLIADEIQSGFARTGNWASWQQFKVQPDLSTYAKSLGSGLPIAAVVGKAEIMDSAAGGTIGGTYIGSPLACVAALATIQYMKDINLNSRANEVGDIIMQRFEKIKKKFKEVGDVRGFGAMNAIEFVKNGDPDQPDSELCNAIVKGCAKNGLIIISAGTYKNVIRILSPLVIENDLLIKGLDIIENQIQKEIQNRL